MTSIAPARPRGWYRIALIGSIGIVVLDLLIALAARGLGLRFASLSFCSWLLYLLIGYIAVGNSSRVIDAVMATAVCGLVEGTLGWWLASLIVPLHIPLNALTPTAVVVAVLVVSLTASLFGAIGGLARKWWGRSGTLPHSSE